MTGWTLNDMTDQQGRTVVITGANSGIGFTMARAFAMHGAEVVMACRDVAKGEAARSVVSSELLPLLRVHQLDLAVPQSIDRFASRMFNEAGNIDVLVNNAGIMAPAATLTDQGVELQWATNHLGPFALTGHLLPLLIDTPGARIVTVSSLAANGGDLTNHDPERLDDYSRFGTYRATKLANQIFAVELNRRLFRAGSATISVAAHPGVTHTNLAKSVRFPMPGIERAALRLSASMAQSPLDGAAPILRAATDPAVEGGQYYGPGGPKQRRGPAKQILLSPGVANASVARKLWRQSMDLSGVRYLESEESLGPT